MATNEGDTDSVAVVLAFNEAINHREISALAKLMTAAHRFIDPTGAVTEGKDSCVAAWRGFFDSFPDYRNVFDDIAALGEGIVVVRGRSECSRHRPSFVQTIESSP